GDALPGGSAAEPVSVAVSSGNDDRRSAVVVEPAISGDVEALLPLMLAYCDYYRFPHPPLEKLRTQNAEIIDGDDRDGMLWVARWPDGGLAGFAHITWKRSTLHAGRIAVMEDLFVDPAHRGQHLAGDLIGAIVARLRELGAPALEWIT